MSEHHSIVVVGGGITGLATAWWLHKAGVDVVLLEHDPVVGGTMKTIRTDGWLIETGPNSALETTPLLKKLASDVGLEDQLLYANDAADNRYILREGILHPLPMSPGRFFKSNLWSLKGKLRLLREPFVGRATREETIAEFVVRRLGNEFLDYAINPFVAGVYAGNPEQLSVQAAFPKLYALEKNYGGLIKGQILGARERKKRAEKAKDRARLFSFRDGMQSFPEAIGNALAGSIRINSNVETIICVQSNGNRTPGSFQVLGSNNGGKFELNADAVILAVPAHTAGSLVEPLDASLATSLKNIYYPPVAEVFLGYEERSIGRPLDGFGFLVPGREQRTILGTIWSSILFPNRAPSGFAALTTFVGGSRQPELASLSDASLVELVTKELRSIMHIQGKPTFSRVTRWEKAIPQYRLGHLSVVEQIEQAEHRYKGLFLTGNYRGGISVGDCVMNSELTAQKVSSFIGTRKATLAV